MLVFFQRKCRELWEYLCALDEGVWLCFVGGDFNIIRCDEEKVGGLLSASRAKEDFNTCIHDCGLIELPFGGQKFSCHNGRLEGRRIWVRLDRILVNSLFLNVLQDARMKYLPRTSSDHCPMLIFLNREGGVGFSICSFNVCGGLMKVSYYWSGSIRIKRLMDVLW